MSCVIYVTTSNRCYYEYIIYSLNLDILAYPVRIRDVINDLYIIKLLIINRLYFQAVIILRP